MTRNLLILSMFFLAARVTFGQCTPDPNITRPGFYPDSLPPAVVNKPYSEILQFKIFKDTTVIVFGSPMLATIDSATILKVNGLPSGLVFQLNKTSQTYTPAETGCARISGTTDKAGRFRLGIILNIYAKVSGFSTSRVDTIKNFFIEVSGQTAKLKTLLKTGTLFYPNPVQSELLNIKQDALSETSLLTVFDAQGRMLEETILNPHTQQIPFPYPPGLYTLRIQSEGTAYRTKVLKSR